jgi:Putative adhesin
MRAFILIAAAGLVFGADVKTFNKTLSLDANGRFTLDTYKGSIHVTAWDQAQVEVQARIEEDPGWHAMPVSDVEIRMDGGGGSVHVKTDYRHSFGWFNDSGNLPFVHYTIKVPRKASLQIKDYKSDSDVAGVEGEVEFETYKGVARLEGLRSGLQLKTYKGDVRAAFAAFTASTHVDTYRGTIDLSMPKASAFELHADLERHATLDCDFPRTIRTTNNRNIRSQVNGGGPSLHVASYRGDIRIRSL